MLIGSVHAQAIYPIDKAEILAGSKFDIKVEFNQVVNPNEAVITINGMPANKVITAVSEFILNENGKGSSIIYRDVQLPKAGKYQVLARTSQEELQVTWEVYPSGPRRVKNVILFIGDGMTIANRTAARVLSKGITEGKYQGRLSFDDMPSTAMIGTSGSDSLITDSANSMSAYTTGHKTAVNAMGVYVSRASDNLRGDNDYFFSHFKYAQKGIELDPKGATLHTILEAVKETFPLQEEIDQGVFIGLYELQRYAR